MLPQLATETFASQIFWVVLGFFCVYSFMSCFAVPKLRKILEGRKRYINTLLNTAETFEQESKKIEQESNDLLVKTRKNILEAETKLMEELDSTSLKAKQEISQEILENAKNEIASLNISSEEVFKEVSSDLDELLDLALNKVRSKKS